MYTPKRSSLKNAMLSTNYACFFGSILGFAIGNKILLVASLTGLFVSYFCLCAYNWWLRHS